ncbi:MAG: hypothetical protein ACRD8W_29860 [Nitrososphaeraceae archaeon]
MLHNVELSHKSYETKEQQQQQLPEIKLSKEPKFYVRFEDESGGSRTLGHWHEIVQLAIDSDHRIMAKYRTRARHSRKRKPNFDDSRQPTYGWKIMGSLLISLENRGEHRIGT